MGTIPVNMKDNFVKLNNTPNNVNKKLVSVKLNNMENFDVIHDESIYNKPNQSSTSSEVANSTSGVVGNIVTTELKDVFSSTTILGIFETSSTQAKTISSSIPIEKIQDVNISQSNNNTPEQKIEKSEPISQNNASIDSQNKEEIKELVEEKAPTPSNQINNDLKVSRGGSYDKGEIKNEDGYYAMLNANTRPKAYESSRGVTLYANGAICNGTSYNGVKYDTRTEEETGLRYTLIDGKKYYCVATGSAYGKIGDLLEVKTDTGQVFYAIKGDEKGKNDSNSVNISVNGKRESVGHTFGNNQTCVVEMICDGKPRQQIVRQAGSYDVLEQFSGNIISIQNLGSTQ